MADYFSTVGRLFAADPWLSAVALIGFAGRLLAIHLGIRAAGAASTMARGDFIMFSILYAAVTFVAGGCILMIGAGFEVETGALLLACLLSPVAYYFLAHATARRLADIGWSRHWTWLLAVLGDALLFLLLLCLMPGKRRAAQATA